MNTFLKWFSIILGAGIAVLSAACAEEAHTHVFEGDWIKVKDPTCTEEGLEVRVCSCGAQEEQPIAALGHIKEFHTGKENTCLESGWGLYYTCSRCGFSSFQELPALGHQIYKHQDRAPTCVARGWEAYQTCTRCDYSTRSVAIPQLGHDYVDGVCTRCKKVVSEGLEYQLDEKTGEYWVAGMGDKKIVDLVIPETHEGKPVVGILPHAFEVEIDWQDVLTGGNIAKNAILQTIDIPGSVREIGEGAFHNNVLLRYAFFGEGLEKIGRDAFSTCSKLSNIELPNSLTDIEPQAFGNCNSLKNVILGPDTRDLTYSAFANCGNLTTITFWGTKADWEITTNEPLEFKAYGIKVDCLDGSL